MTKVCYNSIAMMKLQYKLQDFCCAVIILVLGVFLVSACLFRDSTVFADDEEIPGDAHFVTIYDDGSSVTVKTNAATVAEVLERAGISVNEEDIVEPGLEATVDSRDFRVNVHRARPVLIVDGTRRAYVMTASYDAYQIAREAGLTIYDGDEIKVSINENFLEAGAVSTFKVLRNGGRTLTIEEVLSYPTETRYDYTLAKGETYLEQAGEDGRRISVYEVKFENNAEVSRELVSDQVVVAAVPEIIVVGAKPSVAPEQEQCAAWLREAGVAEGDLEAALYIIYHESGCRVDAENRSSGAYGIPQALPGSKMQSAGDDWQTNPLTQIRWMISYVNGRYGGWQGALQFKLAKGWY